MLLSVIIPTRNRKDLLEGTLRSLTVQTLSQDAFEVIVVDNGSTDNTAEVVERFRGEIQHLRYFYENEPGLHVGRHLGLKKAGSGILVYADDDIEAFTSWLEGIKESFGDDRVGLAGGKCLPKFEAAPPPWLSERWEKAPAGNRCLGYLSILDFGDEAIVNPPAIFGCNYAIRKDVLMKVGGFHPDGMPESLLRFRGDGESWVNRAVSQMGLTSMYNPKASIYHYIPRQRMTMDYFYKRAFAQGVSDSYAQFRYPGNVETLKDKLKKWENFAKRMIKTLLFIDKDSTRLDRVTRKGYRDGFSFHQQEVKKDPALLAWVLRENYF
ncbi:MAG TPA: glycosyltransferase family 2 protein [Candidatus Deferrimicrobium sp.]|nr:glycosyltransferase family 2 protein [Candidatus Deferrimicrobium sp.]